jgi:hypothetical protein
MSQKRLFMRTITTDRLRGTASENDVVQLVRDYVGEWLPEELGRLPVECRPGKVRDAEDINDLAFKLTSACVSFDVESEDLRTIEEMDAFLGQACRRMAEISAKGARSLS